MFANVIKYGVSIMGTQNGYQGLRAQIFLYDGNVNLIGSVVFHDPGMPFPNDSQSGGQITMHLPTAMFESVLDILRNEKPVVIDFSTGHAFLKTSVEPVGEAE